MTARMAITMATNVNPRLHRTRRGQNEIRKKSHVLTQGERLILALVDGESSNDVLRRKLRGIVERRFRLAIADLKAKGFIEDRMPSENDQPDSLDSATIEKFVRQDPLDPVTITALKLQPQMLNLPVAAPGSDLGELDAATLFVANTPDIDTSHGVDFYIPLEIQTAPAANAPAFQPMASNLIMGNTSAPRSASSNRRARRMKRSRNIQIGYWLLFAGLVCAVLAIVGLKHS